MTALLAAGYLTVKRVGLARPGGFGPILKLSLAPFGLTFSPQITAIFMNRALMAYGGDRAVAVYSCTSPMSSTSPTCSCRASATARRPLISRYFRRGQAGFAQKGALPRLHKRRGRGGTVRSGPLPAARGRGGALRCPRRRRTPTTADILPLFLVPLLPLAYVRVTISWLCATARAGLSYVLVYAEPVLTLCLLAFMPGLTELGVWLAVPAAQIITFAAARHNKAPPRLKRSERRPRRDGALFISAGPRISRAP